MREAIPDLWPTELGAPELTPPVTILRKQAAVLAEKTSGIVEGKVTISVTGTTFKYSFWIVAPALDNYSYRLFSIEHEASYYPLKLRPEYKGGGLTVQDLGFINSEEEFIARVKEILADERTIRIVQSLMAQSQAA